MNIKISDFEIFKFADNKYTSFKNGNNTFQLNQHPYLDIVLTDHCNSNCGFCIANLAKDKQNNTLDKLKEKTAFAVENMNVKEVLLLGGEPTISPLLIPFVKWLQTIGLEKIIITTNGLKMAHDIKFRKQILTAGLTNINISYMSYHPREQADITGNKQVVKFCHIVDIHKIAKQTKTKIRINNNIFKGNNNTVKKMELFYLKLNGYCDSIKFSPLFKTDNFSVLNRVNKWVKERSLYDKEIELLFKEFEDRMSHTYNVSIIENPNQFGFVKNTMIPLKTPVVMNWNFGEYTGMMNRVIKDKQINNIKLLSNGELSLSWNKNLNEYFIKTK